MHGKFCFMRELASVKLWPNGFTSSCKLNLYRDLVGWPNRPAIHASHKKIQFKASMNGRHSAYVDLGWVTKWWKSCIHLHANFDLCQNSTSQCKSTQGLAKRDCKIASKSSKHFGYWYWYCRLNALLYCTSLLQHSGPWNGVVEGLSSFLISLSTSFCPSTPPLPISAVTSVWPVPERLRAGSQLRCRDSQPWECNTVWGMAGHSGGPWIFQTPIFQRAQCSF